MVTSSWSVMYRVSALAAPASSASKTVRTEHLNIGVVIIGELIQYCSFSTSAAAVSLFNDIRPRPLVFAQVTQSGCATLPVLAVERYRGNPAQSFALKAPQINTVAIRIGTRHIKRLDSADRTE